MTRPAGMWGMLAAALCAIAVSSVASAGERPARAGRPGPAPPARTVTLSNVVAPSLLDVAADAGTGVAVGSGVAWWSATTHQAWFPAAGVDSALTYNAVIKSGGRYVIVAENGTAWTSADGEGKSFLQRAAAATVPLRALAEVGGPALVAVGDQGTIVRCADLNAVTWTAQTSGVTTNLRGIAWNGVSTVAVGDSGRVLRAGSPGIDWQVVPVSETRDFLAITVDPPPGTPGRYLAVGRSGAAWRGEADGVTWTKLNDLTAQIVYDAVWVGPAAVVVGQGGLIQWSPGAYENWDPVVSNVTRDLHAVTFSGHDVLAVGREGTILWSLSGLEWRRADVPIPVNETSWGRVKELFRH